MKGRGVILFCLAVLLLAGLSIVGEDGNVEAAPQAHFTYLPKDPVVDEVIKFDASLSSGEDLQYKWIFEDGHEPTGMVVEHTFQTYGFHNVILIVTNSTGGMDTYSKNIYVTDKMDPAVGIAMFGFMIAYMLFYFILIFSFVLFYALNAIIGGILAYKVYQRGKENDQMETAKPYFVAHLIAGGVSIFMPYLCIPSIIAHIVIYMMFKSKMRELGINISKKKDEDKTPPPGVLSKPPESPPTPQTPQAAIKPQPQTPPQPTPQTQAPPPPQAVPIPQPQAAAQSPPPPQAVPKPQPQAATQSPPPPETAQ